MVSIILSPPLVMIIFVLLGLALSYFVATMAATGKEGAGKLESYACGQKNIEHNVSPDYSQFFPYAFFFTIMHVLVLVVTSAPQGVLTLPLLYVAAGVLALLIIFRG